MLCEKNNLDSIFVFRNQGTYIFGLNSIANICYNPNTSDWVSQEVKITHYTRNIKKAQ